MTVETTERSKRTSVGTCIFCQTLKTKVKNSCQKKILDGSHHSKLLEVFLQVPARCETGPAFS